MSKEVVAQPYKYLFDRYLGNCILLDNRYSNDSRFLIRKVADFIEKLSFNAFNEGTRLVHCVKLAEKLFGEKITKLGGDCSYSGNDNRTFCSDEGIVTSFSQKGKKREATASVSMVKKELARVRATAMEGSFGTQKEHYGLRRINGRIKITEILIIFFGIHTANAVQLARRIAKAELSQAA